jgi:hypothetical protein
MWRAGSATYCSTSEERFLFPVASQALRACSASCVPNGPTASTKRRSIAAPMRSSTGSAR